MDFDAVYSRRAVMLAEKHRKTSSFTDNIQTGINILIIALHHYYNLL